MAASIRFLTVLGLAAALSAACDRTPTGPQIDDVAALLAISNPAAANSRIYNNTLPALFRESIARVQTQQGREGVDILLSEWRGLQEKLKTEAPTTSRTAVQARLAAIHDAELRIVRRVLGNAAKVRRIHGLETLLPEAIAKLNTESTTPAAPVRQLESINARVRAALRAGNRPQSHALLAEARAAQVDLVLRAFGNERVALMIRQVDARAEELIAAGLINAAQHLTWQ